MAVFHGGKEVGRTTGAMPADRIEAFVRSAISEVLEQRRAAGSASRTVVPSLVR